MNRRQLLAAGATLALAGCTGTPSVDAADADAGRTLRLTLIDESTPLRSEYVVDLAETRPARDERAFRTTLDGDGYTSQHRPPFGPRDDPVYTRHEGTYYRLGSDVVDEVAVTRPVVHLSAVGDADAAETPSRPIASRRSTRR